MGFDNCLIGDFYSDYDMVWKWDLRKKYKQNKLKLKMTLRFLESNDVNH